ncbi:MAG: alpha/beta fold hydrolase [Cyanobacteria bacterium CRU_2_1]|nr:alpha/beta fold hydrolase [Cyanobacteria bacterium RU_5_0]NJR61476.1 alpha/beta fold hydrolase [Cyanobacteria bacterium CRU_2_1]
MTSSTISSAPETAQTWIWRDFSICYQTQGQEGAAVVLVHGFGASCGHWRKNIPVLAASCRVYAIDLIGFGGSAKPAPGTAIDYTFETWGDQIADFCREVIGTPVFLVGNSIGCIAAMQTAVDHPDLVLGVVMLNCSLRLLHDRRRAQLPWYRSMGTPILQRLLAVRWIGHTFFRLIAKPKTVRKILLQAYADSTAVSDELVDLLMRPATDLGAADVFLAFTRYSQGPLPEDLLEKLPCPALMLWGTDDPWEPIALGRDLAKFPAVQQFIPIEGAGHCPQDEAPDRVNPILQAWIQQQTESSSMKRASTME